VRCSRRGIDTGVRGTLETGVPLSTNRRKDCFVIIKTDLEAEPMNC
jgi:hypothetical protein